MKCLNFIFIHARLCTRKRDSSLQNLYATPHLAVRSIKTRYLVEKIDFMKF